MQGISQRRAINIAEVNQKGKKRDLAFNTHLPILTLPSERERPESPGRSPFCRQRSSRRSDHVQQFLRSLRDLAETSLFSLSKSQTTANARHLWISPPITRVPATGHRRLPGNPSRQDHRLPSEIPSLLQTPPPPPPPSSFVSKETAPLIRWRNGELIGCGAFGRVYMGMNLISGELLAVKQVLIAVNSKEKAQV
ncbi:hypothetical protein ACLB2K_035199 [Fragaria x ananassa]